MARRKLVDKNTRKISKSGSGCYRLTVPMEMIKDLGWKEKQKVVFKKSGKRIYIEDWVK